MGHINIPPILQKKKLKILEEWILNDHKNVDFGKLLFFRIIAMCSRLLILRGSGKLEIKDFCGKYTCTYCTNKGLDLEKSLLIFVEIGLLFWILFPGFAKIG